MDIVESNRSLEKGECDLVHRDQAPKLNSEPTSLLADAVASAENRVIATPTKLSLNLGETTPSTLNSSKSLVDLTKTEMKPIKKTPTTIKSLKRTNLMDLIVGALIKMKERNGVSFQTLKKHLIANHAKQLRLLPKNDPDATKEQQANDMTLKLSRFSKRLSADIKKAINAQLLYKKKGMHFLNKVVRERIRKEAKEIEKKRAKTPPSTQSKPEQLPQKTIGDPELHSLRIELNKIKRTRETRLTYLKTLEIPVDIETPSFSNAEFMFTEAELKAEEFITHKSEDISSCEFTLNPKQWTTLIHIAEFVCFHSDNGRFKLSRYSLIMLAKSLLDNKISTLVRETHLVLLDVILDPLNLEFASTDHPEFNKLICLDWYGHLNLMTWQEILRRLLIFLRDMESDDKVLKRCVLKLQIKDYNFLSMSEKLVILNILVQVANSSSSIRYILDSKCDVLTQLGKDHFAKAKIERKRKKEIETEIQTLFMKQFQNLITTLSPNHLLIDNKSITELISNKILVIPDHTPAKRKINNDTPQNKKIKLDQPSTEIPQVNNPLTFDSFSKSRTINDIKDIKALNFSNVKFNLLNFQSFDFPSDILEDLNNLQKEYTEMDNNVERRAEDTYVLKFNNKTRLKPLGCDKRGNLFYFLRSMPNVLHICGIPENLNAIKQGTKQSAEEEQKLVDMKIQMLEYKLIRRKKELEIKNVEKTITNLGPEKALLTFDVEESISAVKSRISENEASLMAELRQRFYCGKLAFVENQMAYQIRRENQRLKLDPVLNEVNNTLNVALQKLENKFNTAELRRIKKHANRYVPKRSVHEMRLVKLRQELDDLKLPTQTSNQHSSHSFLSNHEAHTWCRISKREEIHKLISSLDDEHPEEQKLKIHLEKLTVLILPPEQPQIKPDIISETKAIYDSFGVRPKRHCVDTYTGISAINQGSSTSQSESTSEGVVSKELSVKEENDAYLVDVVAKEGQSKAYEVYVNEMNDWCYDGLFVLDSAMTFADIKHQSLYSRVRLNRKLKEGEQPDYVLNWMIAECTSLFALCAKNGGRFDSGLFVAGILYTSFPALRDVAKVESLSKEDILNGHCPLLHDLGLTSEEDERKFSDISLVVEKLEDLYNEVSEVGDEEKNTIDMFKANLEKLDGAEHDAAEMSQSMIPKSALRKLILFLLILENIALSTFKSNTKSERARTKPVVKSNAASEGEDFETDDEFVPLKQEKHKVISKIPARTKAKRTVDRSARVTAEFAHHGKELNDILKTKIYINAEVVSKKCGIADFPGAYFEGIIWTKYVPTFSDGIMNNLECENVDNDSWIVKLVKFHKPHKTNKGVLKSKVYITLSDVEIDTCLEFSAECNANELRRIDNSKEFVTADVLARPEREKVSRRAREWEKSGEVLWGSRIRRNIWLQEVSALLEVGSVSAAALCTSRLSNTIFNDKTKHLFKKKVAKKYSVDVIS